MQYSLLLLICTLFLPRLSSTKTSITYHSVSALASELGEIIYVKFSSSHWVLFHKTFISLLIVPILHVVCNRSKRESHPGKVATKYYLSQKERRKNLSRLSFRRQMSNQYMWKYWELTCFNKHFKLLNLVDYGRKVSERKLEPNWFKVSALSSFEDTDHRSRIIWTHYHMLVIALTTLPVIRGLRRKVFAYLIRSMKKNRIGHWASSNNTSIISLKFL